jgi:hypothetical protein
MKVQPLSFMVFYWATLIAVFNQAMGWPAGDTDSLKTVAERSLVRRDHGGIGQPFTEVHPAVSAPPLSVVPPSAPTPVSAVVTLESPLSVSMMPTASLTTSSGITSASTALTTAILGAISTMKASVNTNTSINYSHLSTLVTSSTTINPSDGVRTIEVLAIATPFSDIMLIVIVSSFTK